MRLIDEDHITQAVIACHAGAEDARLRDVMTSLVQHLHAFAREVKLTEDEWRAALRFLAEAARSDGPAQGAAGAAGAAGAPRAAARAEPAPELAALSEALGLTMLVTSLGQRRPAAGQGARPALRANFNPPASARGTGPVARLLRALGREA